MEARTMISLIALTLGAACDLEEDASDDIEVTVSDGPAVRADGDHCVLMLDDAGPTGDTLACFDSIAEADALVVRRPAAPPSSGPSHEDPGLAEATVATTFTLGRLYEHSQWGGASLAIKATVSRSTSPCLDNTWDYEIPNLGTYGWNDRVSSFESYNDCSTNLFEHTNFGGIWFRGYDIRGMSSTFNDKASSGFWH